MGTIAPLGQRLMTTGVVAALLLLALGRVAQATTVTLTASGDTWIDEMNPDANEGTDSVLQVQPTTGSRQRALVRFNLSGIPSCANVSLAKLRMTVDVTDSTAHTHHVHRLLAPWTEGGATWNCPVDADTANATPDCDAQWSGGSYEPVPSASATTPLSSGRAVEWNVLADVQDIVGGVATNEGWLVKDANEGPSVLPILYAASGSGRAKLEVTYDLVDANCDDQNPCTTDTCKVSGCAHANKAGPCDDGVFCNGADTCNAGNCVHAGDPCGSGPCIVGCNETSDSCDLVPDDDPCDDGSPCTTNDACLAGVCGGEVPGPCRADGKAVLLIKDSSEDKRDGFAWKWGLGDATTQADFGSPTDAPTNGYRLCVYSGTAQAVVTSMEIPADGDWKKVRDQGYKYLDKSGNPNGIHKVFLKGGADGKAKILVKGKGVLLPDDPALPVAAPLSVRVQLTRDDVLTPCWESTFSGGSDTQQNTATKLRLKSKQ